jgi:phage head maturation protease
VPEVVYRPLKLTAEQRDAEIRSFINSLPKPSEPLREYWPSYQLYELSGYALTWHEEVSLPTGDFLAFRRGSFLKALASGRPIAVALTLGHKPLQVLAGTAEKNLWLWEDDIGLRFNSTIRCSPVAELARDAIRKCQETGCSIRYSPRESRIERHRLGDGHTIFEVVEVKGFEHIALGVMPLWPAFKSTRGYLRFGRVAGCF